MWTLAEIVKYYVDTVDKKWKEECELNKKNEILEYGWMSVVEGREK